MKKYDIKKGFIIQKLGQKIAIFDGEKSTLYTFNETATFIFNKLKSGWEKEKIIVGLSTKYKVKRWAVERDFDEFMKELQRKKIVASFSS